MSRVFVCTCERVYGSTSKPQQTRDMKGPIMLSNLVRPVSFHSIQLTNLPRFKQTRTVSSLTSAIDSGLAHLLRKPHAWSTSLTVNHLTHPAEFMLNSALIQCASYASWRVATDKWLVVRSVEREVRSLIPRFKRVYTVTLHTFEHASCLMCDCKYFECNGMVCHHLAHVKTYYAAKSNITHHDMSHRWW